jgi:hypothetical protein
MAKRKHQSGGNEEAARIILADPQWYAGLPLEWARLWMERRGARALGRYLDTVEAGNSLAAVRKAG